MLHFLIGVAVCVGIWIALTLFLEHRRDRVYIYE